MNSPQTKQRPPESAWTQCAGWARCPAGSYCAEDGVRRPCPAGTFGSSAGLESAFCEGICPAGSYCPVGTVYSVGLPCGSAGAYCPEGSSAPLQAGPGYFTTPADLSVYKASNQTGRTRCPMGFFCIGDGTKAPCPAGRWGGSEGLESAQCSGECAAGFFCPAGSTVATEKPCGIEPKQAEVFCPKGSRAPTPTRLGESLSLTLSLKRI